MAMLVDKFEEWIRDEGDIVALTLRQLLEPVEAEDKYRVIYPPTYADIGYNIDTLADGTKVALVDSVGSQANRMEPLFRSSSSDPRDWLVPQVEIVLRGSGEDEVRYPLLEMAHRAADAVVRSTEQFGEYVEEAFQALARRGDAWPLAQFAPTSLVFGVWDSRGSTSEKRPRLVRAIIRAWDVDELHTAAQFNSVWKQLSTEQQETLSKAAKEAKVELSVVGFADAPATFRKVKVPAWVGGAPNPNARVLGGVLVRGDIVRDVTINLVALRNLRAGDRKRTMQLRRYLLGLALYAATGEMDLYLREGCHLRYASDDEWFEVPRRGQRRKVQLGDREAIEQYVDKAADPFRTAWNENFGGRFTFTFDLEKAQQLIKGAAKQVEAD